MKYGKLAAVAAGVVVGLAFAAPAAADSEPASDWRGIDTAGAPDFTRTQSTLSGVTDCTTAVVRWETQDVDAPTNGGGSSVETKNLGVEVDTGDEVSVDYELLGGADPKAGSVRLFVYLEPNADTVSVGPAKFAAAPDDGTTNGTLSFTMSAGGTIGTAGVVYDTSNGGVDGAVKFTNLTVENESVFFKQGCLPAATPTPDTTASPTPTGPAATPTPDVSASPAAGGGGGGKDQLPATGTAILWLASGAAALLATGGGLYWAARRRQRVTFTA